MFSFWNLSTLLKCYWTTQDYTSTCGPKNHLPLKSVLNLHFGCHSKYSICAFYWYFIEKPYVLLKSLKILARLETLPFCPSFFHQYLCLKCILQIHCTANMWATSMSVPVCSYAPQLALLKCHWANHWIPADLCGETSGCLNVEPFTHFVWYLNSRNIHSRYGHSYQVQIKDSGDVSCFIGLTISHSEPPAVLN